jgi:oligoendopeptidase F
MAKGYKSGAEKVKWNLSDLYGALDDPAIESDLTEADERAVRLAETYRTKVAGLSAEEMLQLLREYEAILDCSGRVGTYAYLTWSTNSEDSARGALLQKATERASRLNQKLLFLELEWAKAPDERAEELISSSHLKHYHHWLEVTRIYRPYLLSEQEEKILSEKSISGRSAWVRYFGEVHGAARYDWEGERVPQSSILNKLYDPDRSVRERAASSFSSGLRSLLRTNTYIFNTILADKSSDDGLRGYPSWISARNLDNQVDDTSVDALIGAVTSRYDIVARYYRLKRGLLDLDELKDYDRYAPLPASDRRYSWSEARDSVLSAYTEFHPQMGGIAEEFFQKQWIDAAIQPGKRGGAYSHGAVPSVHPYLFLNYEGTPRDLMTLAHEMGHGIHQMLSREQGILQADTPLTTAETASVFGEMLLFQDLLSKEKDPKVRLSMLVSKIEDSFATVFRQVAMNRFEHSIHEARRSEGELSTDRLNEIWYSTQRDVFADSVTLTEDYRLWWSYIPHFIHSPGYVYAYAFGELLVLALHTRYREMGASFPELYFNLLKAGGSDWPHTLVKPFGVNLKDPGFWHNGLSTLEGLVEQAEELAETAHS